MKRIITSLSVIVTLFCCGKVSAQSFTMQTDTAFYTTTAFTLENIYDTVIPASAGKLKWSIVATDFPTDWLKASGICDNFNCYNVSGASNLWPSGSVQTSLIYTPGSGSHDYHLQFNSAHITTSGCFYLKTRLMTAVSMVDTAYATFIVCATAPVGVSNVSKAGEELSLYPNPATNQINLVYGGSADIKTAAIYNIIGTPMAIYKISGNNANMSLDNIPAGIYFVRLADAHGQIVATRKFTKQ